MRIKNPEVFNDLHDSILIPSTYLITITNVEVIDNEVVITIERRKPTKNILLERYEDQNTKPTNQHIKK